MKSFKERVLAIVAKIPKGRVMTYQEVAKQAGSPRAYRAVGNIMNRNVDPKVPCHRVVGSSWHLTGYRSGLKKKAQILKKEGVKISKNKVIQ